MSVVFNRKNKKKNVSTHSWTSSALANWRYVRSQAFVRHKRFNNDKYILKIKMLGCFLLPKCSYPRRFMFLHTWLTFKLHLFGSVEVERKDVCFANLRKPLEEGESQVAYHASHPPCSWDHVCPFSLYALPPSSRWLLHYAWKGHFSFVFGEK